MAATLPEILLRYNRRRKGRGRNTKASQPEAYAECVAGLEKESRVKIEVDHLFAAAQQELWKLLHDPARLAHCIPGCEQMVEAGRDQYTATLKIGVASVKGSYVGQVQISEQQPYSDFKLSVDGSGRPGFVRGLAAIGLLAEGERQTRLSINGEAQVGGLIASVGQRLLHGIARQMIGTFFRNIEKELGNGSGTAGAV